MAILLHIETATDFCSVAIAEEGQVVACVEAQFRHHNDHSKNLTLFIEQSLKDAGFKLDQIHAVAVSRGPGSYSALRVGTSVAKGICYALEIPLIAIDTLKALALATKAAMHAQGVLYIPMIDARRMEVYYQVFDDQLSELTKPQSLVLNESSFSQLFDAEKNIVFSGNGSSKAVQLFADKKAHFAAIFNSARHLVPLAFEKYQNEQFEDLAYYAPLYLKPPNITTPKKRTL